MLEELIRDVVVVAEEFFEMPAEEKKDFYSDDPKRSCRLYTSIDYDKEKVHFWRENLRHPCHPLEDHIQFCPQNPTSYRYVTSAVKCLTLQVFLHNLKELEKLKEKGRK